jgi:hypothetical protein
MCAIAATKSRNKFFEALARGVLCGEVAERLKALPC